MSEADNTTVTLIATSWQALQRAENNGKKALVFDSSTKLSDCIVTIVFASFFLEANLNHILKTLGRYEDMQKSCGNFPGLYKKLSWFYKEYAVKREAKNKDDLTTRIKIEFPDFDRICEFRNDVAHGNLDSIKPYEELHDLEPFFIEVGKLRNRTKEIVDKLFEISDKKAGCVIPRNKNYKDVLETYMMK